MKDAPSRLLAEFLGVFFLCLFGIGAIVNTAGLANNGGLLTVAFAHGLAILVAICAFGHISGAHFNPAVTVAFAATKRIAPLDALAYIVAQLLGGAAAAIAASYGFGEAWKSGVPSLGKADSTHALVVEVIATFALMFVIMGAAVDARSKSAIAALPIGLVIVADILWCGPLSGAAMNPARWFGPALVNNDLSNPLVWIVGPIVGALIAAFAYDAIMKPARDA
jgi:MIP family channel proteins